MSPVTIRRDAAHNQQFDLAVELFDRSNQLVTALFAELDGSRASKSARNEAVSRALLTIWEDQQARDLPAESPAIVTDGSGRLAGFSVAGRTLTEDASNLSTIASLRESALKHGVPQFDKLGFTFHGVGDGENFDGWGAIYNYATSEVALVAPRTGDGPRNLPGVAGHYWSEAREKRSMELVTIPTPAKDEKLFDLSAFSLTPENKLLIPRPRFVTLPAVVDEYLTRWKDHRFERDSSGLLVKSDPRLKELMEDLHKLASVSVDLMGGPFSAAIISPEGLVISFGVNRVVAGLDAIAHGERTALVNALESNKLSGDRDTVVRDLAGCSMVNSSETCISCEEQTALFGIVEGIYGNDTTTVHNITRFTEGPRRPGFAKMRGFQLSRLRCDEALETEALSKFKRVLDGDSSRNYLADHGKID